MRKRRITTSVLALVLLIGLSLLLYPTVSDKWNSYHQSKMIISHAENVAKMSQEECDTLRRAAQEFNRMLLSTGGRWDKTTSYKTEYEKLLISDDTEIMAYIGKRDIANCLRWTAEYVETGSDLAQFVRDH